jgi:predicted transcriptional regulator
MYNYQEIRDIYPPSNGVITSDMAAGQIEQVSGRLRNQVLDFIRAQAEAGATAQETDRALGMPPNTITPRIWELRKLGLIRDSGETRPTASKRKAKVWVAISPSDQDAI